MKSVLFLTAIFIFYYIVQCRLPAVPPFAKGGTAATGKINAYFFA